MEKIEDMVGENMDKEREALRKIAKDIIADKIKSFDELRTIWPKNKFQSRIYNILFDDLLDSFEHIPLKSSKKDTSSFEYLRLYAISRLLEFDLNEDIIETIYKTILSEKNITKDIVDEILLRNRDRDEKNNGVRR